MPTRATEMTPAQIKALKHPGGRLSVKVAVGGVSGLHVQIQPSGAKSWVLRTRYGEWAERRDSDGNVIERGRKKREIGLGAYPDVLPGMARDKAREAKAKLEAGIDPIAEKKAAQGALVAAGRRGLTFAVALDRCATEKVKEFRSVKYCEQWKATITKYAVPKLGEMLVQDINLQDILKVLQPIWTEKTETASKLRQRIEKVLAYATVAGHGTGDNPARWGGNLDMILPAAPKVAGSENYPALQLDDVARWWTAVQAHDGMGAMALRFQAMTATRTGAIRFASWSEIDLEGKVWTIQPGRQSSKIPPGEKAKRIPLTADMIDLLNSLPRLQGSDLLFWAPKGGPLSDATIGKAMRSICDADVKAGGVGFTDAKTGEPAVPHWCRSTFRTWVAECTGYDGDMAEIALFHKVGSKVAQAYDRSEQVEKRRAMMAAWGEFLAGKQPTKVVKIEARK